jgi:hypothetical protein
VGHVYNQLSGHAHTSFLSVLQLDQATSETQQWMCDVCISMGLEIMAHFIAIYATCYHSVAKYLDEHQESRRLLEF